MGGLGQRFRDEGYETPKPLIEVKGKQMFLRALDSFDAYMGKRQYIFVVRTDAENEYGLASSIRELMPEAKIAMLDHNTEGAAQTVLTAKDLIEDDKPLVVMDCDFAFSSAEYFDKVTKMINESVYDGVLLSFKSDNPRYSYARLDDFGRVVETAEKKVISDYALAGAYSFASGALFKSYAEKLIDKGLSEERKEYYISYVYAEMLYDDRRIGLATVDRFDSFGTPSELKEYLEANRD